jgi:hypothetical protein
MKPYIVTTGIIFGLLLISHVARVVVEGTHLIREPIFLLTTIASGAVFIWAITLFVKSMKHKSS